MDTPTPHPQPTPESPAQQFRGLLRVVNDLGTATDTLFKRIYGSLSQRRKTLVDTEALHRAQSQARALQKRARIQGIEIARLTGVLASIDEGVVMQDPQGRIILMNEAARGLLGGVKNFWDSPLGVMFVDYTANVPLVENPDVIEPLGDPKKVIINERTVGARLARVFSNRGILLGTVMVLSDMTMDTLADRLKTSFITQMSHELRTPLTSIKGMSDVLLNLPEGRPPNRKFLEAISRNVATLDRMIVELLDLSEIEANSFQVQFNPLNLQEQVFTVVSGLASAVRKADLSMSVYVTESEYLNTVGDDRRLRWALGHLIENAIQYTLPTGEIMVELGRIRNGKLLIKVRDTGVGVSDKDLPRIFERYYRGEARTPEGKVIDPRGLGQGLYIAKAVIEAHGGTISIASKVHEGTTVIVALPLRSTE